MKKTVYLLLLGVTALLAACHEPEYVNSTGDRQGFTSLVAIFTSGPFAGQQMAKLELVDGVGENLVIPVPWYYPETSDDETDIYMTKVRVQAELQENCFIEPALAILDLTKENHFTYTDASGIKKKICITGKRVKSDKCELLSFSLLEPAVTGIVDKDNKKVSLISVNDLSACLGEAQVSAHATIAPDPSAVLFDYNKEVEFTVTAQNGIDKKCYTVVKEVPGKISSGFNQGSVELLFNFDPVATLEMPAYTVSIAPSMAAVQGHLVVCPGDRSVPVYLNRMTGVKMGNIKLGNAVAGSVTNDEAEHMLIVNHAEAGAAVNIYKTSSVVEDPVLFCSFMNDTGLPMGAKMKVIGNIDEDALVIISHEGVSGVTESSEFTSILVRGGEVQEIKIVDIASAGISWGSAPVDVATVVAASIDPVDGWFESKYSPSMFNWVKGDGTIGVSLPSDLTGWGLNPNCLDSKRFNNVNYVALFAVSHFPAWGMGPQLFLYDVNDKSRLVGNDVGSVPALVLSNQNIEWYQRADAAVASGDVVMAPTADGFKLYIYYYDHNSGVIGGYVADCIAK